MPKQSRYHILVRERVKEEPTKVISDLLGGYGHALMLVKRIIHIIQDHKGNYQVKDYLYD